MRRSSSIVTLLLPLFPGRKYSRSIIQLFWLMEMSDVTGFGYRPCDVIGCFYERLSVLYFYASAGCNSVSCTHVSIQFMWHYKPHPSRLGTRRGDRRGGGWCIENEKWLRPDTFILRYTIWASRLQIFVFSFCFII